MSLNTVSVMGRLTRAPELNFTQSGTPVTSFSLAVERDFKDKETGERAADFIDCVAWRNTAEFICDYFTKGSKAVVNGRLTTRSYKDSQGVKRKVAEIITENIYFAESKQNGTAQPLAEFTECSDDEAEDVPF